MQHIIQLILALSSLIAATKFARNILDDPGFTESRILFDFTEFTVMSSILNSSLPDSQVSPYVYFSTELFEKIIVTQTNFMSIVDVSFITSSSKFLTTRNLLLPNLSLWDNSSKILEHVWKNEIEGIVFQVNSTIPYKDDFVKGSLCLCKGVSDDLFQEFESTLDSRKQHATVIGIEIDEKLIDCCGSQSFLVLGEFSLVALRVVITPETAMLTPGLFTSRLENVVLKFQKFVRRVNLRCALLLRIKFNSKHVLQESKRHLYLAYFKEFIEDWNNSGTEKVQMILETYPQMIKPKDKNLANDIIPFVYRAYIGHYQDNLNSICQSQEILNSISSSFDNVFLYKLTLERFRALNECCCDKYVMRKRSKKFKLYVHFDATGSEIISMLDQNILNLPITTLFISPPSEGNDPLLLSLLVKKTKLFGVKIGCHPKYMLEAFNSTFKDFMTDILYKCDQFFNASSVILVDSIVYSEDFDDLPRLMLKIDKTVSQFNQNYKDKKLMIMIILGTNEDKYFHSYVLHKSSPLTIYCDSDLMKQVEISHAIANYANVFDLGKIALQSYSNQAFLSGWWSSVETTPEINRSVTDFPVLVQRNVPLSLRKNMALYNSYQCINWTADADPTGIKFSKTFSGVSLNTSALKTFNSSITMEEIRFPLLFIFGKFSIVELVVNQNLKISTLKSVVNQRFLSSKVTSGKVDLYLELPRASITPILLNQIESFNVQLSEYENFTFGMHLSGWENQDDFIFQTLQTVNNINNKSMILIGLTVDCLKEVNHGLQTLKKFSSFLPINYIVCNMHPIVANNYNQATMQTFMDTIFYLKSYILRLHDFQHLQVFFRINYVPYECDAPRSTVDEFLRFLNDMNQHGRVYNIKYFIVPAFGNRILSNNFCTVSWWKISKDSDLTNISAYTERESEHFWRKTLPGLDLSDLPNGFEVFGDETKTTSFMVGLTLLFLGFLLTVFALSLKIYNMRKRYLTKEEVETFRNGKVAVEGEVLAFEEMKFLDKFEIEKHNVELCKVIGRGNFGLVYRGLLNDELPVAVKMPHSECSKESFKSMLAEVKIMSYIGTHPNVLSLVATYTKEIQKGQIFIITELCEKGSLQNHLRSNPSVDCIGLYELQRFAYQIASGMDFISGQNIIHGDLSTRNVLLNEDGVCKIGDFGLSRKLYEYEIYIKKSKEPLPWRWMALESLQRMEFTTKSDVWSYGVTLWEIFSYGKIPYMGLTLSPEFVTDLEKGMRLPKDENLNDEIYDKINSCWNILPENRPSFCELAQFFADLQNKEYDVV